MTALLRGRSEQLAVALSALTAAQVRGEGSVLLVTGEPGIGKTAFLRAVREQADRRGFAAGYAAADESNQLIPGAAVLLALRSGVDPLLDRTSFDALAEPSMQPLWLAEDVAEVLDRRAQQNPVVVVLDDLQWADQLSRFLLRVLSGRLAGSPVVWVLASRTESAEVVDMFSGTQLLDGVRNLTIELGPLPTAVLIDLATDILGEPPSTSLSSWLDQVDGNPFLAVELAQGTRPTLATDTRSADDGDVTEDAELPTSFSGRLRGRLLGLGEDAVAVLQLAAAWGGPLPAADARLLLPGPPERLKQLLTMASRAGLLDPPAETITFRHDLVREFVYRDLPPAESARLHRLIAHHLIDTGHRAIAAAQHAAIGAGSGDRRCVDILREAAAESVTLAPATAAQLMRQAFEAVPATDRRWAEIGEQYAHVLRQAQRGADALTVIDTLLARTDAQDDRARLQVIAAQALWLMGEPEGIATRTQLQLSRRAGDPSIRVRLESARALALSRIGKPGDAWIAAEAAVAQARVLDDRAAEVTALHAMGEIARNQGRHLAAFEYFHELRTSLGADFLSQEVLSLQHIDRFAQAQQLLDLAVQRSGHHPDAQSPALASAQVWQNFNLGRFDDANTGARSLIRLGDELGNYVHRIDARIAMTICSIIHGDLPGAHVLVAQAYTERTVGAGSRVPGLLLTEARIAVAEGDHTRARDLLRLMDADTTAAHLYWSRSLAQFRLRIGIALAVGDRELAEQTRHQSAIAASRNNGVLSYQGTALQVSGLLTGNLEELGAASDILARGPRPSMGATAVADHGLALIKAGHNADGVSRLEKAWATFQSIGFLSEATRVQQALYRAGVRTRRPPASDRPSTGWASLTPAEVTVAQLVAEGHTNRAAAKTLGVSVNTVGTHLSSIFVKLAVRSRLQLSHAVRRAGDGLRQPTMPGEA